VTKPVVARITSADGINHGTASRVLGNWKCMKRIIAATALLFASGLVTTGAALVCLYRMSCVEMTPACHHQDNTKVRPASCCDKFVACRKVSRINSRFLLVAPREVRVNAAVSVADAASTIVAAPAFKTSVPVLTLRV
jgi:hypothetical protein